MSDKTPDLGRIRTVYMDHRLDCLFADCTESMAQAEFDRAIAEVRADAKAEALREAADEWAEGEWAAAFMAADDDASAAIAVTAWLQTRADNLDAS